MMRLPQNPVALALSLAGLLLLAGAPAARAQLRAWDYSQRSTTLSPNRTSEFSGQTWGNHTSPELNKTFGGQRVVMGGYEKKISTMNGQTASTTWNEAFQKGALLPLKMKDAPDLMRPQLTSDSGRFADMNSYTSPANYIQRPGAPAKFADAYTFNTGAPSDIQRNAAHDFSMQDIGRFMFRSSHSSDPGLPVTRAGAGSTGQELPRNAHMNISTPALFDYGGGAGSQPLPTSQVRTGASVAPRIITSEGDRLMLPQRRTSLGNPLPQSSGSGLTPSAPPPPAPPSSNKVISGTSTGSTALPKSVLNMTPEKRTIATSRVKEDWED